MKKLNEGMRPGDLEDLVLPMITVDEYESKVDDDAIVMGFYCGDRDASIDLNRFIQKSAISLIDTEVSPAPDQHGYYLVFVELLNDLHVVKNIEAILEEVSPLAKIDEWQMRLRGYDDGVIPFSSKVLDTHFEKMRDENKDALAQEGAHEAEGRILEFLTPSDLSDAVIEGKNLTLSGSGRNFQAEIVGFGEVEALLQEHSLTEGAMSLAMTDVSESIKLSRILGEGWFYSSAGDMHVLQHNLSDTALLLRNTKFV